MKAQQWIYPMCGNALMKMESNPMPRPSPQTDRVVAILNLLAAHLDVGFSLSEIATRIKQHKTSLYPMLTSLEESGFIIRNSDTKRFHLGPALIHLGEAAATSMPLVEIVRGIARKIFQDLKMHVFVFTFTGKYTTLIEALMIGGDFGAPRLGTRTQLALPTGTLSVAWREEAAIREWAGTPTGEPVDSHITAAMSLIRQRMYSVELRQMPSEAVLLFLRDASKLALPKEEQVFLDKLARNMAPQDKPFLTSIDQDATYHIGGISAPIFDRNSEVVMAITVSPVSLQFTGSEIDHIGRILVQRAAEITTATGGRLPL